jgi:hypothetical protein
MRKIVSLLSLLGLFFIAQNALSATYYVSPSGSNGNTGTLASPWRSINTAVANLKGGDTLYVRGGTYAETVNVNVSGTASSPITITAYPGELPVIDGGTTLPAGDWGVLMPVRGSYNNISGLEIKNSNITGRYVAGRGMEILGQHNTISKMNVHHTWGGGILVLGDYNIVEDSRVWQNCLNNSTNPGKQNWGTGMSAAQGASSSLKPGVTSYVTLRRNTVFNNWGEGLSCYEADHCILEDNIVYDNWSANLYISDTTNSLVQRNIVYVSSNPAVPARGLNSDRKEGIVMADERADKPRSVSNTVINNFIYNSNFEAFVWTLVPNGLNNVLIANNTIVDGNLWTGSGTNIVNKTSQITNNIITGRNSRVPSNSGITFSYNNWAVTPPLATSPTNINGDPRLTRTGVTTAGNLTPDYFKILSGSAMIGKGATLTQVTNDYFSVSRSGRAYDIGGHQLQTTATNLYPPTNLRATPR